MFKQLFSQFALVAALAFNTANAAAPIQTDNTQQINAMPITLRAGTNVTLSLNEEVDPMAVSVGNAIEFMVRNDVTVNGKVLIAAGAPALGMVKKVEQGCDGKCVSLTIVVESVQAVDGQNVNLNSIPHTVKAPCCEGSASASISTTLSTRVRNDIKING